MAGVITELLRRRMLLSKKSILPSGYTEVSLVTNTGNNAYVNTGYDKRSTDIIKIECVVRWNQFKNNAIIGADAGAFFGTNKNGKWYNANLTASNLDAQLGVLYNVTMERTSVDVQVLTIEGVGTLTTTRTQSTKRVYLFNALTSQNYQAICSLGRTKIYINGNIVRDFIPCKNSSDVYGFYDLVTEQFYTSNSSTPLSGE